MLNLNVSWFLDDEDDEEDELTGKANEAFASQDKPTEVAAYSETKETVISSTCIVFKAFAPKISLRPISF